MADDDENVIPFPGLELVRKPTEGVSLDAEVIHPPVVFIHDDSKCPDWHRKGIELRDVQRRAYCKTCGVEVDLFDYVKRLASDWMWMSQRYRQAERRTRESEARLVEALRLERNAKGRLRTAREKLRTLAS